MDNQTSKPSDSILKRKPVFQNAYVWLIFLACLDIMCTWIVLWHHGIELNPVAKKFVSYGPKGLVLYKLPLMVFVIFLCEIVGRKNRRAAQVLIGAAIALTCIPILLAIFMLYMQKHHLLNF